MRIIANFNTRSEGKGRGEVTVGVPKRKCEQSPATRLPNSYFKRPQLRICTGSFTGARRGEINAMWYHRAICDTMQQPTLICVAPLCCATRCERIRCWAMPCDAVVYRALGFGLLCCAMLCHVDCSWRCVLMRAQGSQHKRGELCNPRSLGPRLADGTESL